MTDDRLIAPAATREDEAIEASIRPRTLDDYLGQAPVREQMQIYIEAAKGRREALDHVLIFGPPGLGKTTLAHIVAAELGVNLRQTSGPVLEKPKDLAAILEDTCSAGHSHLACDLGERALERAAFVARTQTDAAGHLTASLEMLREVRTRACSQTVRSGARGATPNKFA